MNASKRVPGRLCIILAALLWGLAGVCVKSVTWSPMSLVASRSILAAFVLMIFFKKKSVRFTRINLLGALMTSATGILYVQAIRLTTAGTAIVLQYIAPILVFLYGVIFCRRKARPTEALLTLAVFGGILLSFADRMDPARVLGNLLALLSGFTFAAQIIIMNREEADTGDALIISCGISFAISLPFLLTDPALSFDAKNVVWVLILGLFQYGFANLLFGIGIRHVDALESSLLLTLEPIFNPIPVAIFCGETMGVLALIGSAVVILSVTAYAMLPHFSLLSFMNKLKNNK